MRRGIFYIPFGYSVVVLVLAIIAAWWVYRDSAQKGLLAWFWSVVTFFLFPVGFLVYLIFAATKNKNRM